MATLDQARVILDRLSKTLAGRQADVETLDKAYRGEFNLHYASDNFSEFFAERYKGFADNWTAIVADAPHERLEVTGIRLKGENDGDQGLWETWVGTNSDAFSDLAMLDAIIAKRAFALVWGMGDDEAVVTWEHPSQCVVEYDPETRERRAGLKSWRDDDFEYATLYLPDEVWKFERSRGFVASLQLPVNYSGFGSGAWVLRAEGMVTNPLGKVPLVELPNRARLMGEPSSDISGTLAMQHAINLFWSQLFAVSDEATIGQRVILGAEMPQMPVLDGDGNVIGSKPLDLKKLRRDNILWVEGEGSKVAQWDAANLKVFTDVIEIAVGHIAAQTRTPAHYLLIGGTIANVSGDAMKALETGLVKRTEEKTQHFGRAIRDVFELIALVENDPGKAAAVRGGQVLWKNVENRSEAQLADSLVKKQQIGYPFQALLEEAGLPPHEIERYMEMRKEEQRMDPFMLLDPVTQATVKGGASAAVTEPSA